ncbi:MAG: hypothetical protein M3325_09865 [Actinomycetota bacterium]|nr:hypothetical protein [Actinomycetota bacterium]
MSVQLDTKRSDTEVVREKRLTRVAKPASRFALHAAAMCVAMCVVNGLMLTLLFRSLAGITLSGFRQDFPELAALLAAVVLGAVMVPVMRLMRMAWRPTVEMAGSSVAAGALMIVAYWLGLLSETALVTTVCLFACVAMIAVMLSRLPLYTSSHAHHGTAGR